MGILSGGIRIRRFQALGDPPAEFRSQYEEAIEKTEFHDFSADDEREQVMGWVGVDDWFTPGIPSERWLVGDTINLALRIDTKRIPARFLKQECRKLEAEWRLKSGREDLTRAERDEIQSIVRRRLLDRVIPACQGIDMSWDLNKRQVLFWSTSERTCEAFRTLFERTFRLKLRPLFPFTLALSLLGDDSADLLDRAVPSTFRPEGGA